MKIPGPWLKSESEQMHQRENMLSEACGVGVMLFNLQLACGSPLWSKQQRTNAEKSKLPVLLSDLSE